MNFASDNTAGVHPRIMAALAGANDGHVPSYGADRLTLAAEAALRDRLGAPAATVLLVGTGTAANALALSLIAPPWGRVWCHPDAHVACSEAGAPEFYTGGARLSPVACIDPGAGSPGSGQGSGDGRITPAALAAARAAQGGDSVHSGQSAALSFANATEWGTVYDAPRTAALTAAARAAGLRVHLDGARFANAVSAAGGNPAALLTGVDVLSLGATKGGCLAAEAVVILEGGMADEAAWRRKRAGQLWSKHRFLAAQMLAWLDADLWLDLARHANALARVLAEGLAARGLPPDVDVQTNAVFVTLPRAVHDRLHAAGARFLAWPVDPAPDAAHVGVRLVTSWATREDEVEDFLAAL